MKKTQFGAIWEGVSKVHISNKIKYHLLALLFISSTAFVNLHFTLIFLLAFLSIGVLVHCVLKIFAAFTNRRKSVRTPNNNSSPFVSIQVACCNEPAEIVNKTLESLNNLDYEKYEVLIIHNNNSDKANWLKIKRYAKSLGRKFKFYHIDKISGFKAGALGYLRKFQNKRTEIIGIIDSDYIVKSDFLEKTVGYFDDPKVSIVQVPQDYKSSNNKAMMAEYRSFFSVYMNQAQNADAVTFTGTMGLIRSKLFKNRISWNKKCITEDIEIGIKVNRLGHKGIYIDKSFGKGLMPLSYDSMAKQRKRWVYGNMQILKNDSMKILNDPLLDFSQKLSFISQLTAWFHFELVIAIGYILVTLISLTVMKNDTILPIVSRSIMLLLLVSIFSNLAFFLVGMRKNLKIVERLKAFLTHYGLIFTMSYSWIKGLMTNGLPFQVTSKVKGNQKNSKSFEAFTVSLILILALFIKIFTRRLEYPDTIAIAFILLEISAIFSLKNALSPRR